MQLNIILQWVVIREYGAVCVMILSDGRCLMVTNDRYLSMHVVGVDKH